MQVLPGSPHPLGATWDGEGVNFAVYSEQATTIELCLFDDAGHETRVPLPQRTAFVWHGYVTELGPGQRYGFRAHGPYEPARGLRFNPQVVLLDPYAKAVDGPARWEQGCFAYELGAPEGDLRPVDAPQLGVPRALVIDPEFDWEGDTPLRTPLHRSVIYEAHVRGLTMLHPEVPERLRGTYAGIAHPAIIGYLRELGVTAIELMPVHAFIDDKLLLDRGLRNYWGYNTIGFFAPEPRYRSSTELGGEVRELKEMIKALHRAGIEVILDVVYNHTAEGNHLGPSFHLKGLDNPTYYRLVADDPRYYFDYTGTGNTLNVRHPQVLALIMDSLRYWATEMHVDGFRFDLASALARQLHEVDQLSSFFTLIHQSPVLRDSKLIAEPWDVGEGGYQVGNFPVRWAEWNGHYRDAVRALWRGEGGVAREIGYRLTGSSDLYAQNGRQPSASINLVTAHDGFTLADLVSYEHKHNEANGEGNRDGNDNEHAWNCGAEGPTDDAAVKTLRARHRRNLLAMLLLSQGTPMIVAGDERGRTQRGNNNAYCHDNETSWLDWRLDADTRGQLELTRRLLRIRREHPALHRAKFFSGRPIYGTDLEDILWFRFDGQPMTVEDWENPHTQSLMMVLAGRGIDDVDERGAPLVDDDFALLINASPIDLTFTLPQRKSVSEPFQLLVDTANDDAEEQVAPGGTTLLVAHSLKLFRAPSRVIRAGGALHTLGASYRLQLHAGFGFREAHALVDYLDALGITDLYASPIFAAAHGSTHGYDVVDHGRLNEALGSEEDFVALSDALRAHGMGLVLDWVPNHMGIALGQNALWDDVLEHGPSSECADYFDIDWSPSREILLGRVLLPVLGDQYGVVLERGEIRLVWEDARFRVAYYDKRLPLEPKTLAPLLACVLEESALDASHPARLEVESVISALRHLPERADTAAAARSERAREATITRQRFARVVSETPELARGIEAALCIFNGQVGDASSFDALDGLLRAQPYRLASWRVAAEEINYRRFFDINDLAAIRMELPALFERAHALLFRYLDERRINALRLDHTDGLHDPRAYLGSLQQRYYTSTTDVSSVSPDDLARPLPILVEKILEPGEQLPSSWPVDGTTGYDFAAAVTGLWVDPRAERPLTELYQRFTGDRRTFDEHVYQSKLHTIRFSFASELNMLARALARIASEHRRWMDFTLGGLARTLMETIAAFPVYRTYLREGVTPDEVDVQRIQHAIALARRRNPSLDASLFAFLEDTLLMRIAGTDEERREHARFALRFQQLTGPVMAKAVEDTAFYRSLRLVCLNEVGGSPERFGTSKDELHRLNAERARSWPLSMVTTSTHDTKRGEDARARIAVVSEMPDDWRRAMERWSTLAASAKSRVHDEPAPSRSLEYLLYQSLVGVWPLGWDGRTGRDELRERVSAYLLKASKEAKQETSWTTPVPAYDEAVQSFVRRLFELDVLLDDVRRFCERIAPSAITNSLAQTLLRLCVPGIPDTYQGAESWDQSLVDPDNRRPVDFAARRQALSRLTERAQAPVELCRELLASPASGDLKLYVTHVALSARKQHPALFRQGDYEALPAGEHVFAFTRGHDRERLVCIVPRLTRTLTRGARPFALGDVWGDERLRIPHAGKYRNGFTSTTLDIRGEARLCEVLSDFPVALLLRESEPS